MAQTEEEKTAAAAKKAEEAVAKQAEEEKAAAAAKKAESIEAKAQAYLDREIEAAKERAAAELAANKALPAVTHIDGDK